MSTKTTTTTTTTTITSSCDSTSTSASMPAAAATTVTNAGQPAHTACVIPPVGRDNLRYGSLDAAAMNDEGTLLSMALIDTNTNKLRPMSSMEYAEPWLLTTAPSDIDSPMTGTAANSRRPSADTGLEQTYASAFHHHNNSIFGPLTMVTDQDTAAAAAATVSNAITNGPRRSSDQESTQEGVVPHKTIRKKTSLASKIRKVFIKPMSGSSTSNNGSSSNGSSNGSFSSKDQDAVDIHHGSSMQALEDIMSMSSREGEIDTQGGLLRNGHRVGVAIGATAGELCLPPPASHLTEHRGSVSSSSSGESVSVGQGREGGGLSPCTPSTSPEVSPSGSPKPKHALAPLIIGPSTTVAGNGIPDGHPLSPVEINSNQLTLSPKPLEKRMSLEPTSSRTSKKRLSFASITSFFNARNTEAMAASNKKKQQRSSSVPNVESPLTGAGRQQQGSAAFQRRHSLNDLETGPQLQAKFAAPPWDKDRISAQAAAAAAEVLAHKVTENETSSGATTMSKIQGVFGKQSKKNKIKKGVSNSEKAPIAVAVSSSKPLRSALAHRPVRAPSVRKVQVVHRHQGSNPSSGRRLHQVEPPLVNLLQEPTASNSTNDSRRNSEEHGGRTGPTRHRRQSSIAGRQASQQGHYPQMDRKQRHSVRYSSSEEYDILHHSDLYTLDQHQQQQQQLQLQQQQQQQQQFQYHGGYVQYDGSTAPQTPRVNPVSTKPLTPNHGSPSKDMSPQLASVSTPKQQQYQHNYAGSPASTVAAAIGNPHRRSSYDATSIHRRSSYEANSRRNSMVVTSSVSSPLSPPLTSTPVARLSVDHTLMSDHPGPSSSPSAYPQAIASVNGGHQHAIFANHQQQQQLQLQQQLHYQQQQQQFQLSQQHHHHQQMHYIPDHQHHHHHQYQQQQQQQFMNPHAGSQIFHEQYHIQQKQQYPPQSPQSYQQYPPYPYQYTMQQPLPSHLYYTSVQHPALAYTGVNSSSMQPPPPPPPPLQYPTSKSSGSGSGGNPSPTSWSSVSPSPAPSTPPRRASRQLHFSTAQPQIHETWTPDQYDRTSDPNITAHKLTPAIAQRIKLELNTFKSQEMLVHQESRVNTHFFA
ncbi:hypothetical protein BGZ97_012690 [Linnemannia gamsii]|uniref:Uncharacterized protein n=1 Tax=Linnemannia gamsii TaxID=64522 RepID=A0A9P6R1Z1_9FUNG|nr:hypothetical protein BGZ97_012690 [Linnemannia gamsii]